MICDGRRSGDHCCWIAGRECEHLRRVDGRPRCGLLIDLGSWEAVHQSDVWKASPVAAWFAVVHPGFGCGDWPQNIPKVMADGVGLCCWQEAN